MSRKAFADFGSQLSFKPRTIEFTATTGRAFVIKELNGSQQRIVDQSTKLDFVELAYKRAAASIVSIEGYPVPKITEADDFERLLELLSSPELDQLVEEYSKAFVPRGEDAKKDPGDSEPGSSPTPDSPESPTETPEDSPTQS